MSEAENTEVTEEVVTNDSTATEEVSDESAEVTEEVVGEVTEESSEAVEETVAEIIQKYTVNVSGRQEEVTVDDMIKNYQTMRASNDKFQSAATKEKETRKLVEDLAKDPIGAMAEAGYTSDQIKDYIYGQAERYLSRAEETEEQKELRELKEFKEGVELQRVEAEEKSKTAAAQTELDSTSAEIESEYVAALEANSIPSDPNAIRGIAQIQLNGLKNGYDIPIEEAAQIYDEERREYINSMFDNMDTDTVLSYLGKDRMKEVRSKDLEKIKTKSPTEKTISRDKPTKITASEFFNTRTY